MSLGFLRQMMVLEPSIPEQHGFRHMCAVVAARGKLLGDAAIEALSQAIDLRGSGFGQAAFATERRARLVDLMRGGGSRLVGQVGYIGTRPSAADGRGEIVPGGHVSPPRQILDAHVQLARLSRKRHHRKIRVQDVDPSVRRDSGGFMQASVPVASLRSSPIWPDITAQLSNHAKRCGSERVSRHFAKGFVPQRHPNGIPWQAY